MENTTIADGKPMEKTTIADGEPMEKTTIADGKPKLMKWTKLDKQIKYFWSKYPSGGGSIVSYAEEHAEKKTFPEGFISKFVKDFNTSKAVMEHNDPPRVLDSEVEMAMAENQKVAANKTSKKKKKTNTIPTDFESVKQMLISSKSKERELSAAQVVMSRIATEFSYGRLDSSMSEEELRKAEEARRETAEKAKNKKERKLALKMERKDKKLDTSIAHLENSTKNCGYVRPYPAE